MKDKKRFWMPARRRHATQFLHGAAELLLWVLMIGYIFLIVAACNFMAEICPYLLLWNFFKFR